MSFGIILTKRANDDLQEVIDFYYLQSQQAAQSFLLELFSSLDMIAEHPKSGAVAFGKVRKKVMLRFPFNIYYTIKAHRKEIIVARIWHQRRNPTSISTK